MLALYVVLGAAYAVSGYAHAILDDEKEFKPRKFSRTLAIGAIAGVVVAARGEEPEPGSFEVAMGAVIPVVDQIVGGLTD
ncbi:hypothetical protein JMJ58_14800 [Haloterrigena salifodinae]|uniref:Uncharacterized protein n=1 Tax=Haloterrigena salifodinae TaxID=2675099 RepID=A0A8T8DXY4_9EURY|nr:hypothetical protein [Haloterrigena salifodinae]QRV14202.1 hypothetical protein JMJ58_14800 [Haloterrigena salifodinae]